MACGVDYGLLSTEYPAVIPGAVLDTIRFLPFTALGHARIQWLLPIFLITLTSNPILKMYDRKTWIVLSLCGALLAANWYYMDKDAKARALHMQAQQQATEFNQAALKTSDAGSAAPTTAAMGPQISGEAPDLSQESTPEALLTLETPESIFTFSNRGGGLKTVTLKNEYAIGNDQRPIIINERSVNSIASLTRSGFADKLIYTPIDTGKPNSIGYIARSPEGVIIKKTYSLLSDLKQPGAPYMLELDLAFEGAAETAVALNQWALHLGSAAPLHAKEWPDQTTFFYRNDHNYTYTPVTKFKGGMLSKEKNSIEEQLTNAEMAGVCDQFFTIALTPKTPFATRIVAAPFDVAFPGLTAPLHGVRADLGLPTVALSKGEQKSYQFTLFTGPKNNHMLRQMDGHWASVMNYGFFSPISRFLNWMLHHIHDLVAHFSQKWSWGIAIILLTLVVRTLIWPLYNQSNRAMKRMAKLKPEMDKLREKYESDPAKLNTETMKLYKKYGVNPIGGCLPMLLQIPIFFGFYRMLQYAIELRHEPFLWVMDLSQPDTLTHIFGQPLNVLPIVMTITSFLQIAMTPKTGDKAQQRMMMFMPFIFLIFCYSFASALALYWTTQNIFTIFQTWITSKLPEPELKERKDVKPGKKSFMERMVEKQIELQKAQQQTKPNNMRNVTPPRKDDSNR